MQVSLHCFFPREEQRAKAARALEVGSTFFTPRVVKHWDRGLRGGGSPSLWTLNHSWARSPAACPGCTHLWWVLDRRPLAAPSHQHCSGRWHEGSFACASVTAKMGFVRCNDQIIALPWWELAVLGCEEYAPAGFTGGCQDLHRVSSSLHLQGGWWLLCEMNLEGLSSGPSLTNP